MNATRGLDERRPLRVHDFAAAAVFHCQRAGLDDGVSADPWVLVPGQHFICVDEETPRGHRRGAVERLEVRHGAGAPDHRRCRIDGCDTAQ